MVDIKVYIIALPSLHKLFLFMQKYIYICVRYTTVDDALSLNPLQGSLCLSKLLITKLYIYMYLFVLYVKSNQSNHTN